MQLKLGMRALVPVTDHLLSIPRTRESPGSWAFKPTRKQQDDEDHQEQTPGLPLAS